MKIDIAIIGLGSRGLSILERCIKFASQVEHEKLFFTIDIIEPQKMLGVGIHSPQQPDYILLNTICSQLSMFPDASALGNNKMNREGPDLYQWAKEKGYKLLKDGYTVSLKEGREIQETDHLPRWILGEYLHWFYKKVTSEIPNNLIIRHHPFKATNILPEETCKSIILENGDRLKAEFIFITTGHTSPQLTSPRTLYPYPLPKKIEDVNPEQTVAISGFGLSSMDVIASLTVGRGGKHKSGKYIPSGLEPKLVLYSRSGLPFRARPLFNRQSRFTPIVFSSDYIDFLKIEGEQLDFQLQIKPLIKIESTCRYYLQHEYLKNGWESAIALHKELCQSWKQNHIHAKLDSLENIYGAFDLEDIMYPKIEGFLKNTETYQSRTLQIIHEDLIEAQVGIHNSPLKTALETLRDLRDVIRYVVNWGGLNDRSHDQFMKHETALMNRLVIGPQKERHQELLALADAGIISIPLGPQPNVSFDENRWKINSTKLESPVTVFADWLIQGYTESVTLQHNNSALIHNLVKSGCLTPFKGHCSSVNINRSYQPFNIDGQVQEHIWVLGPLLEGTTFYNHYIPSPYSLSLAFVEAHQCVKQLFDSVLESLLQERKFMVNTSWL